MSAEAIVLPKCFKMHQSFLALPLLLANSLVAAHGGVIAYTIDGKKYST